MSLSHQMMKRRRCLMSSIDAAREKQEGSCNIPDEPIVEISGIGKTKALERQISLRLNYRRTLEWYDIVVGVTNADLDCCADRNKIKTRGRSATEDGDEPGVRRALSCNGSRFSPA